MDELPYGEASSGGSSWLRPVHLAAALLFFIYSAFQWSDASLVALAMHTAALVVWLACVPSGLALWQRIGSAAWFDFTVQGFGTLGAAALVVVDLVALARRVT